MRRRENGTAELEEHTHTDLYNHPWSRRFTKSGESPHKPVTSDQFMETMETNPFGSTRDVDGGGGGGGGAVYGTTETQR